MKISAKQSYILLMLFSLLAMSSCSEEMILYKSETPDRERVFEADSIIYYGVDFSKVRLSNPEKAMQDEELTKFFGAWISWLDDEIPPKKYIARWLKKKERLVYERGIIQERFSLVPNDWVIIEDYSFPIDTVKRTLKTYDLKRKDGVGFVVNAENLNKRGEYVSAYYTFFDIKTREVLWSTKAKGNASSYGMTEHWARGILDGMKEFVDQVYKKEYRNWK